MKYTDEQLFRETQLLLARQSHLINMSVGDEAAKLALQADSRVGDWPHPDELVMVPDLPIWELVRSVEAYVREAIELSARADLQHLNAIVRATFNDAYVRELIAERESDHRANGPAGAFESENGAGEQALGHLYSGILVHLVDLAFIRQKIDGDAPLTVQELSVVSGIKESTVVTNIHRGNLESFEEGSRRFLRPSAILKWLIASGYMPTREKTEWSASRQREDFEYAIVPMAGDGTPFDPSQMHSGAYLVVEGDQQHTHRDYREALAHLCSIDVPRWVSCGGQVLVGSRFGRIKIPKRSGNHTGMIE